MDARRVKRLKDDGTHFHVQERLQKKAAVHCFGTWINPFGETKKRKIYDLKGVNESISEPWAKDWHCTTASIFNPIAIFLIDFRNSSTQFF